jgi:DNA-binding NarL/FixJ family response regulator
MAVTLLARPDNRLRRAEVSAYGDSVTLRVVLAEDNALLRHGLSRLVEADPELDLVGTATDLPELLSLVDAERPDVVVSDIRMPPTGTDEGIAMAAQLRTEQPDVGVVLLSQHAEADYALALLDSGSAGRAYLLKERVADVGAFVDAVERVAAGGSALDPEVVGRMLGRRRTHGPLDDLTPREREVLAAMAEGKSNRGIAESFVITETAVEKHVTRIFNKLGLGQSTNAHRRVLAVLTYLRNSR